MPTKSGDPSRASDATIRATLEISVDSVCRICLRACAPCGAQELITPCSCKGSVALVHIPCIQSWLKAVARRGGDVTRCELCRAAYHGVPGFPMPRVFSPGASRRAAHLLPAAIACILAPPAMRPFVLAAALVSWWLCGLQDDALLCATTIGVVLSLLGYGGVLFGATGSHQVPSLAPGVALCFRANDGYRHDRNPFSYSVVLVAEYSVTGAVGYIVNKPLTSTRITSKAGLGDLTAIRQLRKGYGGPVPIGWSDGWEVLHTGCRVPGAVPSGLHEVHVGGSRGRLAQALSNLEFQQNMTECGGNQFQALAVQGYAGWAPLQLDSEIRRKAWTVHNVTAALIFGTPSNQLWSLVCSLPDRTWNGIDNVDAPN